MIRNALALIQVTVCRVFARRPASAYVTTVATTGAKRNTIASLGYKAFQPAAGTII